MSQAKKDPEFVPEWGAPQRQGETARSLDDLAARLQAWIRPRTGDVAATVERLSRPVGAGGSNETVLFDLVHRADGKAQTTPLVLRIEPSGYRLFRHVDLQRQFELLKVLHDEFRLRVPKPYWFEGDLRWFGQPFFIMERLNGKVPVSRPVYNVEGFLFEATPAQRHVAWRTAIEELARIHMVPAAGLEAFAASGPGGSWALDYQEQLKSYEWAAAGRSFPFMEETLAWLEANRPKAGASGLSWGDARIGNMIFGADFHLAAVLDWEQASLGGPMRDLGWWLFFDELRSSGAGAPRLPGLGDRQETIDLWRDRTGQSVSDLEWYEIYTGFQLGVLMIRRCDLIGRVAPGENGNNNQFTRLLAQLRGIPQPPDILQPLPELA